MYKGNNENSHDHESAKGEGRSEEWNAKKNKELKRPGYAKDEYNNLFIYKIILYIYISAT